MIRSGRIAACLIPLLLALGLLLAPAAHAGPKLEVALQDDDVFASPYGPIYPFDKALGVAKKLNVTYIRSQILWSNALTGTQAARKKAPTHPQYDFGRWDTLVAAARQRGIHVQLVLTGPAPAWATGNHKTGVYEPNARLYGRFVAAAVKHFRGTVRRFSLWNEPNWIGWLAPVKKQPALYRALYRSAYAAARAADPSAQILMGETSPYYEKGLATAPLKLMRGVLCLDTHYRPIRKLHCKPLAANGYAVHPYDPDHAPTYRYPGADNVTIGTLSRLPAALDAAQRHGGLKVVGAKRMPLFLTEFGYRTTGKHAIAEAKRAKYEVAAFRTAQRAPRVRELLQYQLVEPPPGPHAFWKSNLLTTSGKRTKTYNALLAWTTYAARHGLIAKPAAF